MTETRKNVRTYEGFLDVILEEIRKLDSGNLDLDVATAKHNFFKDALRAADQSLQAARLYGARKDIRELPLIYKPEE